LVLNWLTQVVDPTEISAFFTQFQADMQTPAFWVAVGKMIWINVLLSGDNALVIAMACRGLHGRRRFWGMVFGASVAVGLRIAFTGIVATLMALAFLKLVGGLALLVIAAKLLVPDDENDEIAAGTTLWQAVRIVVIADIIMSLDNVIAVAAAADGQLSLLVLGLAISIPLIIAGAALIMVMLDRFPMLIFIGAILLGWVAGDVIATDPAVEPFLHQLLAGRIALTLDGTSALFGVSRHFSLDGELVETLVPMLGAIVVVLGGMIWRRLKLGPPRSAKASEVSTAKVDAVKPVVRP
jgi:YjbE family integral membrane protein